jgi:hypothetical protein
MDARGHRVCGRLVAPSRGNPARAGWYEQMQHLAVPREGVTDAARARAAQWFHGLRAALEETASWRPDLVVPEDVLAARLRERGRALGFDDERLFLEALDAVANSTPMGGSTPSSVSLAMLEDLAASGPDGRLRLRLVHVPKDAALEYVRLVHSKLPAVNPRGLLFTYGARYGGRLVAVATVNTPTAPWKRPDCPVDGIVELSRVASDGSVKFASSFLAGRAIDLLPVSGRRGASGCLLVTYSLVSETGSTYLGLANKGLRPVARIRGKVAGGARRLAGAETALRNEDKIVWQAGPAADPPAWSVLEGVASPAQIATAMREFEAWRSRQGSRR